MQVSTKENSKEPIKQKRVTGNQYVDDPRQMLFLQYYNDPKSETFSNASRSAVRAGYSQDYADNITIKGLEWLEEDVGRRRRILNKAERRLEELLDSKDEKIVADLTKHATKTLGKEHYSERTELTGKDGKDLLSTEDVINKLHNLRASSK